MGKWSGPEDGAPVDARAGRFAGSGRLLDVDGLGRRCGFEINWDCWLSGRVGGDGIGLGDVEDVSGPGKFFGAFNDEFAGFGMEFLFTAACDPCEDAE